MTSTPNTREPRLDAWRRFLADAVDVLRLVPTRRRVGMSRADVWASNAELLEQQERTLHELRKELDSRLSMTTLERELGRYTVLWRLDVGPALTMRGTDALRWILSRIEDESHENLVHDHWHPEIAGPLQVLLVSLRQALQRAGESTAWVSVDGERGLDHDTDRSGGPLS